MKMHKYEVYVLDFQEESAETFKRGIEEDFIGQVFHIGTSDVGEWNDDHPLNHTKNVVDFQSAMCIDTDQTYQPGDAIAIELGKIVLCNCIM